MSEWEKSRFKAFPERLLGPRYQAFGAHNYRQLPQIARLSKEQRRAIDVVAQILPFRTNNYVVDELIDWSRVPDDPMFQLTFPQPGMLPPEVFARVDDALRDPIDREKLTRLTRRIRLALHPHPAGQQTLNVPYLGSERLEGMQHKYAETVLFFPSHGQTCHAYCSFCFRWPQFVKLDGFRFAQSETGALISYLREHPEVTDLLITGGDPMVMKAPLLAGYLDPILRARLPNLRNIRIGSKALSYWPHRFLTDDDASDVLHLFRRIVRAGLHLSFMAHVNHPVELSTEVARNAIDRIRETGAEIRTQTPLLRGINAEPEILAELWTETVARGCIPYYLFVARDTGARDYFGVTLAEAWRIFQGAYERVSGLARTVRGPCMSATPGKVQVLGVCGEGSDRRFLLRYLQHREPTQVLQPFFAEYDPDALWFDDLRLVKESCS